MSKNIDKREFSNTSDKLCGNGCPFLYGYYCDLYDTKLEVYGYDDERESKRCKMCIKNVEPNPNDKLLKELKSINSKLDILLSRR